MKTEDLQAQGLTKEQIDFVMAENGKDIKGLKTVQSDLTKAEADRDKFKSDYEAAKATLDGFEGKDFEAITKERDEWKGKAEKSEKDYREQLSKRDYSDAVKIAVEKIGFSSNSAKKAFIAELEADPLKIKDGKLLGFDDFVKSYKETDATAFKNEAEPGSAQFTQPMGSGGNSEPVTGDPNKMDFATYKAWRQKNQ